MVMLVQGIGLKRTLAGTNYHPADILVHIQIWRMEGVGTSSTPANATDPVNSNREVDSTTEVI